MTQDRLDEIKAALSTVEAPWFRPDRSEWPEDNASGKEDKTIIGADSVSEGFEGGGFCVIGHAFRSEDADFAASAPDRLQWAVAEITRLRELLSVFRASCDREAGLKPKPKTGET